MKRILKYLGFSFFALILSLVLYLLAAFVLSKIPVNKDHEPKGKISIYILTNGVHTDFVLPLQNEIIDWSDEIKFENTISKDTSANFLAVGWGDKGFYLDTPTWSELKFSTAFNAAFGLSTCALHTTFYDSIKESDQCKKIEISKEEYGKLVDYVKNSFQWKNNHIIHIQTDANYNENDAFYEGVGSYSCLRTCNSWTNNGLKAAGLRAAFWTPFDTGIFYHYQ